MDLFDHPFWDEVRSRAAVKAIEIRRQGFSGPAMLGFNELEYGGITKILERLEKQFQVRPAAATEVAPSAARRQKLAGAR